MPSYLDVSLGFAGFIMLAGIGLGSKRSMLVSSMLAGVVLVVTVMYWSANTYNLGT